MSRDSDKLKKLKELIDKRDLEQNDNSSKEGDVSEIIKRLRKRESEKYHRNEKVGERIASIKHRVEGTRGEEKVHSMHEISNSSSKLTGRLSGLGKIYKIFKAPINMLAKPISKISAGSGLKDGLESANINLTPEAYILATTTFAAVAAIFMLIFFVLIGVLLEDASISIISPFIALASFGLTILLGFFYPSAVANERSHKIDRELPFALRQLATQVKAGVSFHKSLTSIANSKYGVLSLEFQRVLNDIEGGISTDQALSKLAKRTRSKGLKKAITQILRALKLGGNLSETITTIANDVSFELRMKVRDFTEKLNFISVVYIMIAVVGPVVITILSSIAQLPLIGGDFPFVYIIMVFVSIIISMFLILLFIKRMEPA